MSNTETETGPGQTGLFTGYIVEAKVDDGGWVKCHELNHENKGHPAPVIYGGILETIELVGYEQAMAIAWEQQAAFAARGTAPSLAVRVVPYSVNYNIESIRKVDEAILVGGKQP